MPPKKDRTANLETEDDVKKTLDIILKELSELKSMISGLHKEIDVLKKMDKEKEMKMAVMETRIEWLEQCQYEKDVMITGLNITHRTYARAVGGSGREGEEQNELDRLSTEEQVLQQLKEKGIGIEQSEVDYCFLLRGNFNQNKKIVVMRMLSSKARAGLMKQGKKLKGTNIYVNERLTRNTSNIARRARELRKQGKIENTWTRDGKVHIKKDKNSDKTQIVKSLNELDSI